MAGTRVIVGGGEDRTGERVVLGRIVEPAGGERARIAVLGTATTIPGEIGPAYEKASARSAPR